MSHYILDACALVNLYCGWGGLTELRTFGASWCIGETALREAVFVRDFANGGISKVTLDPAKLALDGNLDILLLETEREHASFVDFSAELDDGEAQAMALALHRGRTLVTDDRPAVRLANDQAQIVAVGTPEILKAWVNADIENQHRLPEVIKRISVLGPFQLRRGSPHYLWWQECLNRH